MNTKRGARTPFLSKRTSCLSKGTIVDFDFFSRQNVKNTQHALTKILFSNNFLYCHPCLSAGSKEIFIQNRTFFFLHTKELRRGQRVGDMSPKKSTFFN